MLLNTEGLPGPVTMNKFGNPETTMPRYVRGPADHFSFSETPARPRMSISVSAPVIASKPVANTILSSWYSAIEVRRPELVISSMGVARTSTRVTFSRLNVS